MLSLKKILVSPIIILISNTLSGTAFVISIREIQQRAALVPSFQIVLAPPQKELFKSREFHLRSNNNDYDEPPPGNYIKIILSTIAFITFWPLLAYLRYEAGDIVGDAFGHVGFDVDTFMALKDITNGNTNGDEIGQILEIPTLSPAEKLVGALFGPP